MAPINLTWIVPLILTFSGAIYGFGRLVQRVTHLETNVDLLRGSIIRLEAAVKKEA